MSTTANPPIYLAGGQGGNSAGQSSPGELELAYQNLLSDATDVINGINPTYLVLSAAAITSAASFEVGLTQTASEVANNLAVLQHIAAFCTEHNIKVMVEANLTSAPTWPDGAGEGHNELVDQWAQVAAAVGLPIAQVEDVQEVATASPASTFADFAATEANAVRTLIEDYVSSSYHLTSSNLAVGDMEGGPPDMNMTLLADYWNAYNSAAIADGVPTFSFTTSDTGWFGPWIDTLSVPSWQGYLTNLSTTAAAANMTLNVLIQGAETSTSANQFVLQAEQNAADLARLAASGAVNVGSIIIQSWEPQPVGVDLITSPTSSSNEAAEIRATYPLYFGGLITAQGAVSVTSPGQFVLTTGTPQMIGPISLTCDPADALAGNRLAIVVIDQTGTLESTQYGTGTVSKLGDTILILNGDSADLAQELNAITINEPNAGPDTIDIEVFGSQGRIDDTQISLLAGANGQSVSAISATSSAQGWLTSSAILNSGTVITADSKLISETLYWSQDGQPSDAVAGGTMFVKTISIHEPLAEYGIQNASSLALGTTFNAIADIFDPTVDNIVSPANGYANNPGINNVTVGPLAGWLPASFDPAAQLTPLIVVSTTKWFDPNSGQLQESVDLLAPDPLTVVDRTGTHADSFATAFANGGRQVVEFNTGSNAAWMSGWGTQFSSATLTYSGDGHLVELFLQGGAADPLLTIDYVFDPNNGQLWEEFQATTPPPENLESKTYTTTSNPYQQGYATGPRYVTEFNTGNNPNWDYLDWGSSAASDTEVWTDNFIMANFNGLAENFPGQFAGALNAYPYEFVNGATLDLMYLPGQVCVNLNQLATITLDSQIMASGLNGLRSIDAAGATGSVTITGLLVGGSTLIGGDVSSTIIGFGRDTIIAGAGETTINTGSGKSSVMVSSANGAIAVNGNDNVITAVAGSTVTAAGTGDVLTYLNGGTLNQWGSDSSATVTGSRVTVWMQASGGSVNITGDHNQVTGGTAATIDIAGNNNVAGARAGTAVNVNGQQNIVCGANVSVSVAQASSIAVTGDNDTMTIAQGATVTAAGTGDVLTYLNGGTLNQWGSDSSATVTGSRVTVWMQASGGSVNITGDHNQVTGGTAATIDIAGNNNVAGARAGTAVNVNGQQNIVCGANVSVSVAQASSIAVTGDNDTMTIAQGATVTAAGTGDVLTYLNGGTLNQWGSDSSATVTGSRVTVWMQASGGSVNITGDHNQVTGGTAATIDIAGNNNVAGARAGTAVNVNGQQNTVCASYTSITVSSGSSVTVIGNNDTIVAASGSVVTVAGTGDTVTNASPRSVNAGASSLLVLATAANAGLAIDGGQSGATLEISSGGTVRLNAADTNLRVILDVPAHLYLSKLSFITAVGAAAGHSIIAAGGQNQTLQSIGGNDILVGSSSFGDTFLGNVAGLKGNTICNFGGSDVIDITDLDFTGLRPLAFNTASHTLTVENASTGVALSMGGGYQATQFITGSDGHGGTLIQYSSS